MANGAASYEALQAALGHGGGGSGLPPNTNRDDFHEDARKLTRRLNRMKAGLLDPTGKFMEKWDLVIIFVMLYTSFITPWELAFVRTPSTDALFICNQFVNGIFWIDLVFQFFIPITDRDGRTVRAHKRIAYHYLTGWAIIDFVSVLPLDVLDVYGVFDRMASSGSSGTSAEDTRQTRQVVKMVRLLRLLKLLKILRVLRASRVLTRLETRFAMTYTTNEGIKYCVVIIVTLHWFACAWACLATFSLDDPRTTALADAVAAQQNIDSTCTGCATGDPADSRECTSDCLSSCEVSQLAILEGVPSNLVYKRQHWMCRARDSGLITSDWGGGGFFELYIACLVVAIGQLSGGSISIAPENQAENILFLLALLAGSVIWAIVQGVVCGIITVGDPHYITHRQNMDQLNFLMADMGVNQEVKIRVREYYKNTLSLLRRQDYPDILTLLSPILMTDVCLKMSEYVVQSVDWMGACEPDFLRDLFRKMDRESFAIKEVIVATKLNVLNVGVVARGGKFLVPAADGGPIWGDILLTAPALRNMAPARALTYVEVTTLTREALDEVLAEYPISAAEVRRAAMRQSLVKVTELIYTQMTKKRRKQKRSSLAPGEGQRQEAMDALAAAMGGASPDGDGGEDPDDVLRMICGIGGMKYREMEDGHIVGDDDDEDGSDMTLEKLWLAIANLRDEQQTDTITTHARIAALETALMRSAGLEKRDPSFLMRRPAVQRALRTCATLHAAMVTWRQARDESRQMRTAWARMSMRRLYAGWITWLGLSVRNMRHRQLLMRAQQYGVVRALNTWRDNAARSAAEAASSARAAVANARDGMVDQLQIVVDSP